MEDAVHRLLATSQFRGTTTYTISGAEGFQGYVISEHEDLAVVSRAALGIAEYGRAFVAYLEWRGASQEAVEQFEDSYHGSWPNLATWAEATVNGFGWWQAIEQAVPVNLLAYVVIDYRRLGQDMARGMHVVEDDEHHEVHVFRPAE